MLWKIVRVPAAKRTPLGPKTMRRLVKPQTVPKEIREVLGGNTPRPYRPERRVLLQSFCYFARHEARGDWWRKFAIDLEANNYNPYKVAWLRGFHSSAFRREISNVAHSAATYLRRFEGCYVFGAANKMDKPPAGELWRQTRAVDAWLEQHPNGKSPLLTTLMDIVGCELGFSCRPSSVQLGRMLADLTAPEQAQYSTLTRRYP